MGGLGAVSRVSGAVFGSALTFATAGGAPSAPGQLPVERVRAMLELLPGPSGPTLAEIGSVPRRDRSGSAPRSVAPRHGSVDNPSGDRSYPQAGVEVWRNPPSSGTFGA